MVIVSMNRSEVDYNSLSPMMKQYMDIKKEHEDELLFFRLGDFYELFFEDGILASRELELTLTGKNAGLDERIPMCGVPFHSVSPYIEKLVNKGYKVAICEQLEDPRYTKGMVKRGVVQVVSKGTIVDYELLNQNESNYIASLLDFNHLYILTYADISTGKLCSLELDHDLNKVINEILSLRIKEVILADSSNIELTNLLKNQYSIDYTISPDYIEKGYDELLSEVKGMHQKTGIKHLLYYLSIKELKDCTVFSNVSIIDKKNILGMNIHTIRNLELVETLRLKERTNSLLWLLDKTKTAMGSRLLKDYLLAPLVNKDEIEKRYDEIEKFNTEFIVKDELVNLLNEVYDLERLSGKIVGGSLNARDLLQLKNSLKVLPQIKKLLLDINLDYDFNTHQDIFLLLEKAIYENPPVSIKEGYLIKEGYNKELDELKSIRSGGKDFISDFEAKVKEETGIKNLKVGYNKVFGYYIEVSKGQVSLVKDEYKWDRKQTLTNCERFISPLLKEKEALILNAEDRIIDLEYNLFNEIRDIIKKQVLDMLKTASVIAKLDVMISLSTCADEYHLVRPSLNNNHILDIKNGKHPVIEKVTKGLYVPNDCTMDENINTLLITGPNMSGKSTYMRQLAIIIIMAQMGSFVPCEKANLPIIDQIFTRIGASDDLVSGESTFMVEMKEAKEAISSATVDSLILFDELGRGTATFDGMALAKAILEYVANDIGCKTLFSTHYHELTSIDQVYPCVKNVHVAVKEEGEEVTFLHKIKEGPADKSYGIHVAKLASMPKKVIDKASIILNEYESKSKTELSSKVQLSIFNNSELIEEEKESIIEKELKNIDPLNMTPIEAINKLYELKELTKEK